MPNIPDHWRTINPFLLDPLPEAWEAHQGDNPPVGLSDEKFSQGVVA
ncbi:hypothetical protein [Paraburkholderia caledonica]|uniref:Transposase n=1 Tax=Paraburkholderia caledonica TaxID=134536 RepID=A0AB73IPP7_9BURK|nr:hypothetical protein [Paraburkholderia caledonica]